MHAGLNLPGSHEFSPGGREAAAAAEDLARLGDLPPNGRASVAIVYDYEAHWIAAIEPQGEDFRYPELVFRWYEAIRRLGSTSISCARARARQLSPRAGALCCRSSRRRPSRRSPRRPGSSRSAALRLEDPPLFDSRGIAAGAAPAAPALARDRSLVLRPGVKAAIQARSRAMRSAGARRSRPRRNSRGLRRRRAGPRRQRQLSLSRLLARRRRARLADGAPVPEGGPVDNRTAGRGALAPPRRLHLRLQLWRHALGCAFRRRADHRSAKRRLRAASAYGEADRRTASSIGHTVIRSAACSP